jgi:4-amino-4-deoxy-L-arabinose transferase-like glycosyltransferase
MNWLTKKNRPILFQFSGIIVAIFAQLFLKGNPVIAILLFIIGIGIFLYAMVMSKQSDELDIPLKAVLKDKPTKIFLPLIVIAILLGVVAFWLFSTNIPTIIPWLVHILSLVIALVAIFNFLPTKKRTSQKPNPWNKWEIISLSAIFLIGFILRIYRITELPYGFWYDEADHALSAVEMISNPFNFPVFTQSPVLPSHLIFLLSVSIRLFGQTIFAVRIVSVLFGVASIGAAFFTSNELFNRKTALLFAFIFSVARWDLIWSRMGMHGVTVPFFEFLTFGFLLRGIRLQRFSDFFLSGLALGIGLCFYISFRVFPVVVILFLVYTSVRNRQFLPKYYRHLLVLILAAVLVSIPVTQFATFHFSDFWQRTSYVSIFHDRTPLEGLKTAIRTTSEHLLMFNYKGDRNGRHNIPGEPMLDPIQAGLFAIGVIVCLYRIRKPTSFLLLSWWLVTLLPGIFSLDFESPQSYRSIGAIPPVLFLALVPLNALQNSWASVYKRKNKNTIWIFMVFLLVISGVSNVYQYFLIQANNQESWIQHSTTDTIIARRMKDLGTKVQYYVSTFNFETPTLRYLAPQIKDSLRLETYQTFPFIMDASKDAVFFLDPERSAIFNQAKSLYPSASFIEHKSIDGSVVLLEIHLTPDDINSIQGLSTRILSSTGLELQNSVLHNPNLEFTTLPKPSGSFTAQLSGNIYAQTSGFYWFCSPDLTDAILKIDHIQFSTCMYPKTTDQGIVLSKGVHPIEITLINSPTKFDLRWITPGNTKVEPIPANVLFTSQVSDHGLLGKYYPNGDWSGLPKYEEINPFIDFYYHNTPLERPYTVEWTGYLTIPLTGDYELGLESIDESQLYLDGMLTIDDQSPNQYTPLTLNLGVGNHTIKIRFADRTGSTHIHFWWIPPGGERSIVPQEVLSWLPSE